ncbi:branched-chain amino acid ABC transporter substrate-binding protein [Nocardioides sp.]|uniref:branched-chain amino acid ABC transporter substrate-binding protein n=1 Tax=Nocardioides sp. TaxID=35761 RepID=UPI002CDB22F8|nr:branched-chain amino acid ABC transporter substrate-binding protein [Nocardioides sp.]HXH79159.1 branched-chain amino acid ABC transporter substrate-binding protein [Nocardioides sp.]
MRLNTRAGLGALALALTVTATACGSTEDDNAAGGDCDGKIGVMGALSGANSSIVLPSVDGAKLALSQWSEENPDCNIEIVEFDTEGDPAKATPVATKMATDDTFLGVMGGAFSGETRATKAIFGDAGLTMISQSATATDLTQDEPSPVFHRVVGYDDVQGAAIAKYLSDVMGATNVFVIDNSDAYGEPLAAKVSDELGDLVAGSDKTQVAQTDFSPTISKIEAEEPDAIFYGGYITEASPLLKQIRDAGIEAPFIGGDGLYGAGFGEATGKAGEGAIVTCPCVPIEGGTFAEDFEAETGEAPGAYAAEGFDAMSIFLDAIEDGARTREEVEEFVDNYDAEGLTKQIAFDENGDVAVENVVIWAYKVVDGQLVPDQEISLS